MKKIRNSVFLKVTILFIAALGTAFASLVLFNRFYFKTATLDMYGRIRSQSYLSLELSVAAKLDEYATMMYRMVTDKQLRQALIRVDNAAYTTMAVSALNATLESYSNSSVDIVAISAFSLKERLVIYDRSRTKIYNKLWLPERTSGELDQIIKQAYLEKKVLYIAEPRRVDGRSLIHVVLSVWDYYSYEDFGVLVMTIDAASLWKLMGSSAADDGTVDFLMQNNGRILVYPDYSMVGMPVNGYTFNAATNQLLPDNTAKDGKALFQRHAEISIKHVQDRDVYLVSVLNPSIYTDKINYYVKISSLFAVLIAAAFILIYALSLRGLLRSVRAVIKGIEKVRDGDLDVRINIPPKDEIYYIAEAFNSTLKSLDSIRRERDQEFLQFLRESERRRGAEIRSLQSQINSHFLYNTLNTINYTALDGDKKKTSKMIKSLADCLRYTLDKHWAVVKVADEAAWLEKYLLLQKERQPSMFDYNINISENAMSMPIQKLIIQPFVENAIMHGFANTKNGGILEIKIKFSEKLSSLVIAIYDNGSGISEEKLVEIRNLLRNYTSADGLGIGLENTCFRINTHYKSNARIFVRSRIGGGTRFNLLLPIEKSEQ